MVQTGINESQLDYIIVKANYSVVLLQ
uniref:Uncharacterized protein n=1 Tax=Heterorhabditis bacteriophora TaxID=37862 RepID=A0A1I7WL06_HETBA